jgi:tRNA-dihydrouridine synthase B
VVAAVDVPVTLKIRTGWDRQHRNAVRIAHIAENAGIAALSVHGRTRECGFVGAVEYDTIRAVKQAVNVPVTANGDVDSPEMAREVLEHTGADAVMIGRAAQGRPWIFREIRHFLDYGEKLPSPCVAEIRQLILEHLAEHHAFHGEESGVRIARKHLGWYTADLEGGNAFRHEMNAIDDASAQIAAVNRFFDELSTRGDRLTYMSNEAPTERARRILAQNFGTQEAQAA